MTTVAKGLYKFFNSFGIPAYEENSVPDKDEAGNKVDPPYITYQEVDTDWRDPVSVSANVWYKGTTLTEINAKVSEIKRAVGEGLSIPVDGGVLYIYKDSPFSQVLDSGIDNVKDIYLLFSMCAFCN